MEMLLLVLVLSFGLLLRRARAHRAWELEDYGRELLREQKSAEATGRRYSRSFLTAARPLPLLPYGTLTSVHSHPPSPGLAFVRWHKGAWRHIEGVIVSVTSPRELIEQLRRWRARWLPDTQESTERAQRVAHLHLLKSFA